MRAIDAALLRDLAQSGVPSIVEPLVPVLARELPQAGIDTPIRIAHFLGQAVFETGYLSRLSENLNYSASRIVQMWPNLRFRAGALAGEAEALANVVYAGRYGNGDETTGDGWRFRGRGLFQLTFRANYAEFGYEYEPDYLSTPEGAVESAVKFWHARDINVAADEDDIGKVTRLVNGGTEGITERALLKHRAFRALTA